MRIAVFFSLVSCMFLTGCSPALLVSGAAGTALVVGYQQSKVGGLSYRFKNINLEAVIYSIWADSQLDEPFLEIVAVYGMPVIIGAATSKESLEKAKALVFMKSDNVECLADGMKIGNWNTDLAFKVKGMLMLDPDIAARNYYVAAIKKQVWVVGVARNNKEKQAVIDKVKAMDGVESFRYYIKVVNESDGFMIRE